MDFDICSYNCYYNILSKFSFHVAGLKIKVTPAMFRKLCHRSSSCIYLWVLIYLHTFMGMIISRASSAFMQGPELKVKADMTEIFSIM